MHINILGENNNSAQTLDWCRNKRLNPTQNLSLGYKDSFKGNVKKNLIEYEDCKSNVHTPTT
jgi:hypothetical protein